MMPQNPPVPVSPLFTSSLHLLPADAHMLRASLLRPDEFGAAIGRSVAPDWPPLHWDAAPVNWIIGALDEHPAEPFWRSWFIALIDGPLVGTAGFKGPHDSDGFVEIGYSVVTSHWRRGIASEACERLLAWAASDARTRGFRAHTLTGDPASAGVLRKLGFQLSGTLEDPMDGRIDRFEKRLA